MVVLRLPTAFLPNINETTKEPQGSVKPSVAGVKKA